MNKTGFQIKNNYFSAALYMKLIVDNMKYRGIQCDFGRLTDLFFVTPDSLFFAVQRDTDFFQCTYFGRAFNPAQKGVLNKAGFTLHKYNMQRVKHELHGENCSNLQDSPNILNPESCADYFRGWSLKENSTFFQLIKPSAIGTILFAEGCISGSKANRACLKIRDYNN
jgi:hypothetical protein